MSEQFNNLEPQSNDHMSSDSFIEDSKDSIDEVPETKNNNLGLFKNLFESTNDDLNRTNNSTASNFDESSIISDAPNALNDTMDSILMESNGIKNILLPQQNNNQNPDQEEKDKKENNLDLNLSLFNNSKQTSKSVVNQITDNLQLNHNPNLNQQTNKNENNEQDKDVKMEDDQDKTNNDIEQQEEKEDLNETPQSFFNQVTQNLQPLANSNLNQSTINEGDDDVEMKDEQDKANNEIVQQAEEVNETPQSFFNQVTQNLQPLANSNLNQSTINEDDDVVEIKDEQDKANNEIVQQAEEVNETPQSFINQITQNLQPLANSNLNQSTTNEENNDVELEDEPDRANTEIIQQEEEEVNETSQSFINKNTQNLQPPVNSNLNQSTIDEEDNDVELEDEPDRANNEIIQQEEEELNETSQSFIDENTQNLQPPLNSNLNQSTTNEENNDVELEDDLDRANDENIQQEEEVNETSQSFIDENTQNLQPGVDSNLNHEENDEVKIEIGQNEKNKDIQQEEEELNETAQFLVNQFRQPIQPLINPNPNQQTINEQNEIVEPEEENNDAASSQPNEEFKLLTTTKEKDFIPNNSQEVGPKITPQSSYSSTSKNEQEMEPIPIHEPTTPNNSPKEPSKTLPSKNPRFGSNSNVNSESTHPPRTTSRRIIRKSVQKQPEPVITNQYPEAQLERAVERMMKTKKSPDPDMARSLKDYITDNMIKCANECKYGKAKYYQQAQNLLYSFFNIDDFEGTAKLRQEENKKRLQTAKDDYDKAVQKWAQLLKECDNDVKTKRSDMEKMHQEEIQMFESEWNNPKFLTPFNRPSIQLLSLRRAEQTFALAKDFDRAKEVNAMAKQLQKEETKKQREKAIAAMKASYDQMNSRHQKENEGVETRYEIRKTKLLKQQYDELDRLNKIIIRLSNECSSKIDTDRYGAIRQVTVSPRPFPKSSISKKEDIPLDIGTINIRKYVRMTPRVTKKPKKQ